MHFSARSNGRLTLESLGELTVSDEKELENLKSRAVRVIGIVVADAYGAGYEAGFRWAEKLADSRKNSAVAPKGFRGTSERKKRKRGN